MSIEKARLLIRIANQIGNEADRMDCTPMTGQKRLGESGRIPRCFV